MGVIQPPINHFRGARIIPSSLRGGLVTIVFLVVVISFLIIFKNNFVSLNKKKITCS
jgi:hypothetical protein